MSQSLSKLFVHVTFHIKRSSIPIGREIEDELYAYMASIVKDNSSIPIIINGVMDHVHVLCIMSKNVSLAHLVEKIKGQSSRWIKIRDEKYKRFMWQGGYGGFSVSPSVVETTKRYIRNQKEHHRDKYYKEELIEFLKLYEIDYDPRYLWDDED